MNRLGGLIRRMPWTSLMFLVGALSIAALPPFNGFVSEWLTLQTLLQSAALAHTGVKIVFAFCGAGLALTAALAVTCFVKAFAMSFLGVSRSEEAQEASEPGRSMTIPMGLLALMCLCFGTLPTYVIPVLSGAVSPLVHEDVISELVPPFFTVGRGDSKFGKAFVSEFHDLGAQVGRGALPGRGLVVLHRGSEHNPVVFAMSTSYMLVVLVILLGGIYLVIRLLTRSRKLARRPAWDGGIRHLFPDMTYTATGFSNPVRVIFDAVFRPSRAEESRETIAEHFRTAIRQRLEGSYIVDRFLFKPGIRGTQQLAKFLGQMHSGSVNTYAAYILILLLVLLLIQRLCLS
jgi:hydrogenase-4 component B